MTKCEHPGFPESVYWDIDSWKNREFSDVIRSAADLTQTYRLKYPSAPKIKKLGVGQYYYLYVFKDGRELAVELPDGGCIIGALHIEIIGYADGQFEEETTTFNRDDNQIPVLPRGNNWWPHGTYHPESSIWRRYRDWPVVC